MVRKLSDTEAKRCPFCGGVAILESWEMSPYEKHHLDSLDGMFYEVWCDDCQATGPTCLTEEDAINSWNKRISDNIVS